MKNNITWKAHLNQNYKNQKKNSKERLEYELKDNSLKMKTKIKKEFEIREKR